MQISRPAETIAPAAIAVSGVVTVRGRLGDRVIAVAPAIAKASGHRVRPKEGGHDHRVAVAVIDAAATDVVVIAAKANALRSVPRHLQRPCRTCK